jgi:hypothetical protein
MLFLSRHLSWHPFVLAIATLVLALPLFWSAPDARALTIGVSESYEGYPGTNWGPRDYRGYTRYDRLVEILEGWKTIGVDFGVLVGDNIGNDETAWPLLLQAIEQSGLTVYMAGGNHDWVNQVPSGGGSHPDSCFNLKPQEQVSSCPNHIYFLDYLWDDYGFDRPWYSFEQDGVILAFLSDEMFDPRGWFGGGISDIHDEQFYWFRDLVAANISKPIVVFVHHPVFETVAGTHNSPLNRLGWRPREGEEVGDTVSVTNGSPLVIRAGQAFDSRRVTAGAEFQIQGETLWYEISAINGNELTLTTPYLGPTNSTALFGAGGHFNELTQIMKDPGNSIEVVMSGHTSGDFQAVEAGRAQMEIINDKVFAFSGSVAPATILYNGPLGDFFVGSPIVYLTQNAESYQIVPGALIGPLGGVYIEVVDVNWADTLGGKSTVTLASNPVISQNRIGAAIGTNRTEQFTETRLLSVDDTGVTPAEVVNFNYVTGWRSGELLEGSFGDPNFPSADLTDASLGLNGNTARLTPTSAHGVALYGNIDQHLYSVEVELKRVLGDGGGIAFRAQDGSNFYYFELDESSQTFKLGKCELGILTMLAEVDPGVPLAGAFTLKIRAQANRIQTFVDDQPAILFYDTSFPTGRYGLFSRSGNGSDFEDLEVVGDIEPVPEPGALAGLLVGSALLFALQRRRMRRLDRTSR